MAVSVMPDLGFYSGYSPRQIRQRCEITRQSLEAVRTSWLPVWKDCNDYVLPWRARFQPTDNRGTRRNQLIVDSTATMAQRTLSAGMTSGITNPAQPWFQIGTSDPAIMEQEDVKEWCHQVREKILAIFNQSNLYDKLPVLYGDLGTFGTAAIMVLEDDESVIRCYDFQVGSFAVGNDAKMLVRTFSRVFQLSVEQIVGRWGQINPQTGKPNFDDGRDTTISLVVQQAWRTGSRQQKIDIVHVIQPNLSYDGQKIDAKYKRFESVYYEMGTPNQSFGQNALGLLEHSGFDEFPVLCARWDANAEDVYATNWPALTALGDIKQLQLGAKRVAQAIELMIKPPMTGPSSLMNSKTSLLPGDVTYGDVASGQLGFRPVYEVNFSAAIGPMNEMQEQTRTRIKDAFYVNLILMMAESDRREITAREIDERHEEKMLAIGPVLSRLNVDVLDPLIERTFHIANRKGLMPPPPQALQGATLQVEYISIMQQAQKQVALGGLERMAGFIGQYSQIDQSVLDMVDGDELVTQYGDATGVAPKILRSQDQVTAIRQQKAQAAQAQQAAQNAPAIAGAAKDASQATTSDGSNVLDMLLNKRNAKQTLNATATPPASVLS